MPLSVTDEYDVQDLFHAILLLHFDDVRAEEVTPSGRVSGRKDRREALDRLTAGVRSTQSP